MAALVTTKGGAVKLGDPVSSVLKRKGGAVYSVSPRATVYEALEKLAQMNVGALVVLDGATPVGILSERDYVRKVILKGFSSKDLAVSEIMSCPVVTVDARSTIDDCLQCMTDKRCRHLPVLDGDAVVGVVSIGDLVSWMITAQDQTIHQLEDYITGRYPA